MFFKYGFMLLVCGFLVGCGGSSGGNETVSASVDTTVPVITLQGQASIEVLFDSVYNDAGATAVDNVDGDISANVVVTGVVDAATIGAYILTYSVSDAAGNVAVTVSRTVSVVLTSAIVDTTVPVITLQGQASVEVLFGSVYNDAGATAVDNVDGDISTNVVVTGVVDTAAVGFYTLTYNVSDAASNAAILVSRTVNVVFADITGSALIVTPKVLQFSWNSVTGADHYRLLENSDGASGFSVIANNIAVSSYNHPISVHHTDWLRAQYQIEACDVNELFCVVSVHALRAIDSVAATVYMKASNTEAKDQFGFSVSLSGDGQTLAVGAKFEDSSVVGVNGDQLDNRLSNSGAVYLFTLGASGWNQQAYLKASNTGWNDYFGSALSLSSDGQTLAVGAYGEDSGSTGIDGSQTDTNRKSNSGSVYLFSRDASGWSQKVYLKASNTRAGDYFGYSLSLSGDGQSLAVGAYREDGRSVGVNGNQTDPNRAHDSGAVYLFSRGASGWSQQAYLKASNTQSNNRFGYSLSLSEDGQTLAVGADGEGSSTVGIDGNQLDNTAQSAGAVYLFTLSASGWRQQSYLKASNTDIYDRFGYSLSLSGDGQTLAVGAYGEDSIVVGVNGGNQTDNSAASSGAVYLFSRGVGGWNQQAYLKASNTEANDRFGWSVNLSSNGQILVVGADRERSRALGMNGDQTDNTVAYSGAVYLFARDASGWSQNAYIKASNTGGKDYFGYALGLSNDGQTLAVGAYGEDSNATGVNGDQADNTALNAGAVYLY